MYWLLFCLKIKFKKASEQKNAAHWERERVCVCVLDREGTWVYSSVSTALVVVNTDSFVSDRLQWLCDQFLWSIFATFKMSHWFEKCLTCKLYKDRACVCLSLWQWDFSCRAHFSSECWFLRLSVRAFFHQFFIIICCCFLDQNLFFDWIPGH